MDAGVDAGPEPEPIGPWRPAFEPRVIYHRDVECPVAPELAFDAGRTPVAPGAIRWIYEPAVDPAFAAEASRLGVISSQFLWNRLTFTGDGGLVAVVGDLYALGVGRDGNFEWLARNVRQRPDRMWLPPDRTVLRSNGTLGVADQGPEPSEFSVPPVIIGEPRDSIYPVPLPGREMPDTRVVASAPALMRNGTIAWVATPGAIVLACLETAEVHTIIEVDPAPGYAAPGPPALYATTNGELVYASKALYRFGRDGQVLASDLAGEVPLERLNGGVGALGYSDSCGLALGYPNRVEWRDPQSLAIRATVPIAELNYHTTPRSDCSVLEYVYDETRRIRRTTEDGTRALNLPEPTDPDAGLREMWATRDGVLLLYSTPPHAILVRDDGTVVPQFRLSGAEFGDVFQFNAGLMPDGVLVFVTDQTERQRMVAVQTDAIPSYPAFRLLGQSGLNWAHTGGTWSF